MVERGWQEGAAESRPGGELWGAPKYPGTGKWSTRVSPNQELTDQKESQARKHIIKKDTKLMATKVLKKVLGSVLSHPTSEGELVSFFLFELGVK